MNKNKKSRAAFTLLEVMVAVMIFFMCMFSILALVSGSLRGIRAFQQTTVNPGAVAAQFSLTNSIAEGPDQGGFGDAYPDYSWKSDAEPAGTNGLFSVNIQVFRNGNSKPDSELNIMLFRPGSKKGFGK
jgi:hypothetical protein